MKNIAFSLIGFVLCGASLAQVPATADAGAWRARPQVEGAWARATVAGQPSSAYMRITAPEPMQLVGVASPAAGSAEIHEMKLDGSVMRMRAAGAVDLPVGKPFEMKPGGFHVMLQQLKAPLAAGGTVPLTLVFRNAKGAESRLDLSVPVKAPTQAGHGHAGGAHKH